MDNLQDEDRGFMNALQHLVFTSKACCRILHLQHALKSVELSARASDTNML